MTEFETIMQIVQEFENKEKLDCIMFTLNNYQVKAIKGIKNDIIIEVKNNGFQ